MTPTFRQLANAAILSACLVGGAALIRAVTPSPYVPNVTPKLVHLQDNPDAYDVLFIGSSRVYRHVVPQVFERRLAERGIDVRSFNAGIPAARSVEIWSFMNRLADSGVRAGWVFVEPDGLASGIRKENLGTERETYWHGSAETMLAVRSLENHDLPTRIRMSGLHAGSWVFNRLGVGRLRLLGLDLMSPAVNAWASRQNLGSDGDGWVGFVESQDSGISRRRRNFLDRIPTYRRQLANQAAQFSRSGCLTSYRREMLSHFQSAARRLGAEPVFILSPALHPRCEVHEAFRLGLLPNLFAFDDARVYPELYEVDNRFDHEHLNTEGATLYSQLLADAFAEHLEGGGR
ncbi:MAG: hypothetical protein V2I67_20180 [Thermoanaerobaculales bacterium]|nr:hypothetical protein [Thermoanaerobaculales bacterium]